MTDTAKPTPGPWYFCSYPAGNGGFVYAGGPGGPSICDMSQYELPEQNGEFIAEAGTVYYENNLTPRQLVERVRELEAGQKVLLSTLKAYVSSMQIIHEPGRSEAINAADAAAKHIIARFEDAALAKHGEEVS